jgi:hypothetical protein
MNFIEINFFRKMIFPRQKPWHQVIRKIPGTGELRIVKSERKQLIELIDMS